MSKIGFSFNNFLFSKYVKFILSSVIVLFILFNSLSMAFSYLYNKVDFNQVYNVQKDLISAVFVVSKVVDRVTNSFETKLHTQTNSKQENSPAKQKKETFNDVIITAEQSNCKFSATDKFVICFSFADIIKQTKVGFTNGLSKHLSQVLLIYFLMMLCFFTSVIKVYDINITIKKYIRSPLF